MADPILVSSNAGGQPGNREVTDFEVSRDGTKVIFTTASENMVGGDGNSAADVFLKDLVTGEVTLLSRSASGTIGEAGSAYATFSPDGSKVVFSSRSDNLVAGDDNGRSDIFIKDLATGAVTRIAPQFNGLSFNVNDIAFSPDGTKLLFLGGRDTLGQYDLFMRDMVTGEVTLVSASIHQGDSGLVSHQSSQMGSFSPDGSKLVFTSVASDLVTGDSNGVSDLFVKDLNTGAVTRISLTPDGGQSSGSTVGEYTGFTNQSIFSPDGTKILFLSGLDQLVAGDTNGVADLFVKDLQTGAITRITTNAAGDQAQDAEGLLRFSMGVFSPDGQTVLFTSSADNLVTGESGTGHGLFEKNLITGEVTRLGDLDSPVGALSLSEDGTKVLFTDGDKRQVYMLPVTPPPSSAADSYKGGYDKALVISADKGVLANDIPPENATLTAFLVDGPAHGTVALAEDGSFVYTPSGDYIGKETFTYRAFDGTKFGPETTVTIGVAGNIERVNVDIDGDPSPNGARHSTPVFSPDGKFVAFSASTDILEGGAVSAYMQVLLKNLETGEVTLVAKTASGNPPYGDESQSPSFSSDGTKIIFETGGFGTFLGTDVAMTNLVTGEVTLVSTAADGTEGNGYNYLASTAASAQFVSFTSTSTNLIAGDTNGVEDIYVKNIITGEIVRASTAADGSEANGRSVWSTLSADGTKVVFVSGASNLVAGDTNNREDIFVKDLVTGEVTLVSTGSSGTLADNYSYSPVLSADGTMVAFQSFATNLVAGDTNGVADVFVKNLLTGEIQLVSSNAAGQIGVGGASDVPVFSPDGKRIAFASYATNLVDGVAPGTGGVYEKNLETGEIRLVSADAFEAVGTDWSTRPSYSADGTRIIFFSRSPNLVPGDTNNKADIFIKDLTMFPIGSGMNNVAPVANADAYELKAGKDFSVAAEDGVLANDADADGDTMIAELVDGPEHGTLTLNADGSFDYKAATGFTGVDSFTYRAGDGEDWSDAVTVSLSVSAAVTIRSDKTYKLKDGEDNLILTGKKDINGSGNDLANTITGNKGDNKLNGGDGNDILIGGKGKDKLTGGEGEDVFLFKSAGDSAKSAKGADIILDFRKGEDRIELDFDASPKSGRQDFDFIGKDAFHKAGEIRFEKHGSDTLVLINTDNDKAAEMAILLNGKIKLTEADFGL